MKTAALLSVFAASASAFAPGSTQPAFAARSSTALNAESVPLANGAMSFNRVCREWRCKYEGDKGTSESLEASKFRIEVVMSKVLFSFLVWYSTHVINCEWQEMYMLPAGFEIAVLEAVACPHFLCTVRYPHVLS